MELDAKHEVLFALYAEYLKDLPDMFVRCHRGYIVNKNKIRRVINAENLLELDAEIYVPVSRSLKKALKELLK